MATTNHQQALGSTASGPTPITHSTSPQQPPHVQPTPPHAVTEVERKDETTLGEKIDRSIKSEDHPLGEKRPEVPFMVVALSYFGVGILVMLVITAIIFLM